MKVENCHDVNGLTCSEYKIFIKAQFISSAEHVDSTSNFLRWAGLAVKRARITAQFSEMVSHVHSGPHFKMMPDVALDI